MFLKENSDFPGKNELPAGLPGGPKRYARIRDVKARPFSGLTALLLAVVCAPLSAQPGVAGVERHSSLAPADWALREADADLTDFELPAADAAKRDAAMCRSDVSIDGVMASFNAGPIPSWAAAETDRVILSVVAYYRCRAYAANDRSVCEPLKAFNLKRDDPAALSAAPVELKPHSRALGCFGRMNELALVRAYVSGGPEFAKTCAPSLEAVQEFEKTEFASADVGRVCAIIAERRDPAQTCARLKPLYLNPAEAGSCVATLDRLHGVSCEGPMTIETAESCRSYVAFRKAYEAKDVKRCEGLPVCEILMGKGAESCRPYAETFKSLFCAAPPVRLARVEAELRAADEALAGFAGSGEPALPALGERRSVLQSRFERMKKEIGGGAPAAAD